MFLNEVCHNLDFCPNEIRAKEKETGEILLQVKDAYEY
jgi:hypothetical protein